MRSWSREGDHGTLNIILCSVLVLLLAMQLLSLAAFIYSFIPMPLSSLVNELYPRHRQLVAPEREMFLFRCFVAVVILGQGLCLWMVKDRLKTKELKATLLSLCSIEAGWVFVMLFAAFKGFVYGSPSWTKGLMVAAFIGSIMSKLFIGELKSFIGRMGQCFVSDPKSVAKFADIGFPLFVVALIFIPDLTAVVGRMYMGDNLHHMDTALMAQAWTFSKGGALNIDVYSQYGLGIPIFVASITKTLGVFSYEGVVGTLVWASILYFIACYFFLRSWLANIPLAIAGVLIAIKWQMFHPGNYPIAYTYPYSTVIRFVFDIIFFFLLLAHIRKPDARFLWGASLICGLSLFCVSDTGTYLTLAYVFYLTWLTVVGIMDDRKSWLGHMQRFLFCVVLVLLSALAWLFLFQGPYTWSGEFWAKMAERIELFLIGHGNLPIYQSILNGEYLASMMGFVIPLVYCLTLIAVTSSCLLGRVHRRHILAAVLCVYGLGLYHYYVCRSASTSYDTVCIPFVFVLTYLINEVCKDWAKNARRMVWGGVFIVTAFALFSNHFYLSYPNILNLSRNPIVAPFVKPVVKDVDMYFNHIARRVPESWKFTVNSLGERDEYLRVESDFKTDAEFKEYFKKEFDFKEDAALIAGLTDETEKVPLISSFETRLLMQANRKPFFYYYPLNDSRPMRMRNFPMSSLWTVKRLKETITQLETAKPKHIFMERILLQPQVPQIYVFLCPELLALLEYVQKDYEFERAGRFLVAMKRRVK